jgi:hypothetical protein
VRASEGLEPSGRAGRQLNFARPVSGFPGPIDQGTSHDEWRGRGFGRVRSRAKEVPRHNYNGYCAVEFTNHPRCKTSNLQARQTVGENMVLCLADGEMAMSRTCAGGARIMENRSTTLAGRSVVRHLRALAGLRPRSQLRYVRQPFAQASGLPRPTPPLSFQRGGDPPRVRAPDRLGSLRPWRDVDLPGTARLHLRHDGGGAIRQGVRRGIAGLPGPDLTPRAFRRLQRARPSR